MAEKMHYDPYPDGDYLVNIIHGGNKKRIENFLKDGSGAYHTNNNMLQNGVYSDEGIMVHSKFTKKATSYARIAAREYSDEEAVLAGQVSRKYLVSDENDEYSLPKEHWDKIQNAKVYTKDSPEWSDDGNSFYNHIKSADKSYDYYNEARRKLGLPPVESQEELDKLNELNTRKKKPKDTSARSDWKKPTTEEPTTKVNNRKVQMKKDIKAAQGQAKAEQLAKEDAIKRIAEAEKKATARTAAAAGGNIPPPPHGPDPDDFMKWFKRGRNIALVGITAIAIAGVADMAMNAGEKQRAKEQQRAQHQKQVDRDKRSKKYDYAGTEYQPDAFGDVVLEMFNQRNGHYKMGNAKFKANPIL